MARFKASEVDNYGGSGGAGFFSLKNDKDVANVRFLYDNIEDVEGFECHQVEVDGRNRYVNCNRDYNEPIDKCPFCAAQMKKFVKLYIPLVCTDDPSTVKIWERGKKYFTTLSSLCARYPHLYAHTFDIERNGAKGSKETQYALYETGPGETEVKSLEDLPERPQILGGVILDKTPEEMNYYLDNGTFPSTSSATPRRSESSAHSEEPVRRTPSSSRRTPEVF